MTSTVEHKDENWVEFLEFYNMWDERLPEDELYLRYQKFSVVEFPEAPDHLWKGYFADLLQFERGLVFGDAIGEVTDFEFRPDVVNEQPIREKPIPYARHEREWIRGYMSKLEELGVVKQLKPGEPEPLFTVGVVLVREGQSQQDYRMCANLVAPNN